MKAHPAILCRFYSVRIFFVMFSFNDYCYTRVVLCDDIWKFHSYKCYKHLLFVSF
uniref:Uncharacterized protein n=1 Tax=Octopus bimaculoides TaxID=37653 RepID=A0A0L8FTE8_OCTBM